MKRILAGFLGVLIFELSIALLVKVLRRVSFYEAFIRTLIASVFMGSFVGLIFISLYGFGKKAEKMKRILAGFLGFFILEILLTIFVMSFSEVSLQVAAISAFIFILLCCVCYFALAMITYAVYGRNYDE